MTIEQEIKDAATDVKNEVEAGAKKVEELLPIAQIEAVFRNVLDDYVPQIVANVRTELLAVLQVSIATAEAAYPMAKPALDMLAADLSKVSTAPLASAPTTTPGT